VSFYAFFKEWLLPSQPPNYPNLTTLFTLNNLLKTLANKLGCFPFDLGSLHPKSAFLIIQFIIFRSFDEFDNKIYLAFKQCSTPKNDY